MKFREFWHVIIETTIATRSTCKEVLIFNRVHFNLRTNYIFLVDWICIRGC